MSSLGGMGALDPGTQSFNQLNKPPQLGMDDAVHRALAVDYYPEPSRVYNPSRAPSLTGSFTGSFGSFVSQKGLGDLNNIFSDLDRNFTNRGGGAGGGSIARRDSIIQLIGDIAGESSEPIAGPWMSDFGDGVLDGVRQGYYLSGYRSRTLTPECAESFRGSLDPNASTTHEHDFSKHLTPASPVGDGYRRRNAGLGVTTARLQESGKILQHCSNLCLSEVAQRLTPVVFEAGETIIRQREVGRALFFIESGSLEVSVNGRQVCHMSSGESFGEVSQCISNTLATH